MACMANVPPFATGLALSTSDEFVASQYGYSRIDSYEYCKLCTTVQWSRYLRIWSQPQLELCQTTPGRTSKGYEYSHVFEIGVKSKS